MKLSKKQKKHIFFRPSPSMGREVSNKELISYIENDDFIVERTSGAKLTLYGEKSLVIYYKVNENLYLKYVDDEGLSGYSCCGRVYCDYSNSLTDLKYKKLRFVSHDRNEDFENRTKWLKQNYRLGNC